MYTVRPDEHPAIRAWARKNGYQVDTNTEPMTADTAELAKGYDGVVVQQHAPMNDPEIFKKLKSYGMKQYTTRTTGYENINVKAAEENGLTVTNVPAYSPRSVSELVLAHVMWLVRHMGIVTAREAHGDFSWGGVEAKEIHTMTVGIIGAGKIGSAVARIFRALGSNVIANDPIHRPELNDTVTYVDKKTLFATADIVTCHTPLTPETEHMINKDTLKSMKKSAFLINCSRGQVVDTGALVDALNNKEIAGAAIDTFEGEEKIVQNDLSGKPLNNDNLEKLLAMPNVNVSPHVGFYTEVAVENMVDIALDDVATILDGKKSLHEVHALTKGN